MATFASQEINRLGVTPTYSSCHIGGDRFTPGPNTFLHFKNTGAGTRDITVVTPPNTPNLPDVAVGDPVVTIPATTGDLLVGPYPKEFFAASDGLADLQFSQVGQLTCAVLVLKPY